MPGQGEKKPVTDSLCMPALSLTANKHVTKREQSLTNDILLGCCGSQQGQLECKLWSDTTPQYYKTGQTTPQIIKHDNEKNNI